MKHSFLFKNLHNFALYIISFADNAAKKILGTIMDKV